MASTRYTVYQSRELSQHPKFKANRTTAVFVHGFHNTQNSELVKDMAESFVLHNKNYNMVTLDWDYFALLDYYQVASPIAKKVKLNTVIFQFQKYLLIFFLIRFSVW